MADQNDWQMPTHSLTVLAELVPPETDFVALLSEERKLFFSKGKKQVCILS